MAKKSKETVNANNLRTPGFANFEATHEFTAESKLSDFTRAAITAGLTNAEIVEIGDSVFGEGKMKVNCINWYRSSDPVLNPGKERYKATGAKSIEVRTKVIEYYNGLAEDEKTEFINKIVAEVGSDNLINMIKLDVLKAVAPAELFPVKERAAKKEITEVDKLLKKQKAAEAKAAKLKAELEALQAAEAAETPAEAPVDQEI